MIEHDAAAADLIETIRLNVAIVKRTLEGERWDLLDDALDALNTLEQIHQHQGDEPRGVTVDETLALIETTTKAARRKACFCDEGGADLGSEQDLCECGCGEFIGACRSVMPSMRTEAAARGDEE